MCMNPITNITCQQDKKGLKENKVALLDWRIPNFHYLILEQRGLFWKTEEYHKSDITNHWIRENKDIDFKIHIEQIEKEKVSQLQE